MTRSAALEPTVGDLLLATGADNYVSKAHNTLSYLHLETGALEEAERHMDEAAAGGMSIVYGYEDLGEQYARRHRHADAARAYLKAMKHGRGKVTPARKAWENLHRTWEHIW